MKTIALTAADLTRIDDRTYEWSGLWAAEPTCVVVERGVSVVLARGGIIYTAGGDIDTCGGSIDTRGGYIRTRGGSINTAGGRIDTAGGHIGTHGGSIETHGGGICTHGGAIGTRGGYIRTGGGSIETGGGSIETGGGYIGGGYIETHGGYINAGGGYIDTGGGYIDTGGASLACGVLYWRLMCMPGVPPEQLRVGRVRPDAMCRGYWEQRLGMALEGCWSAIERQVRPQLADLLAREDWTPTERWILESHMPDSAVTGGAGIGLELVIETDQELLTIVNHLKAAGAETTAIEADGTE